MASVSNVAIGANMAAAAGGKARHGMNESIARLSTGVAAMYGGDAAGNSVGTILSAGAASYSMAARNIEDGISYLQTGESALLEIANIYNRMRELGVMRDNGALLTGDQQTALSAETRALGETVAAIETNLKFNGVTAVGNTSVSIGTNDAGTAHTAGPGTDLTATGSIAANVARASADTGIGEIATSLGNIAADLASLKALQAVASATSANLGAAAARIMDTDFAMESANLTKNSILNQSSLAMTAQANQAQSAILSILN